MSETLETATQGGAETAIAADTTTQPTETAPGETAQQTETATTTEEPQTEEQPKRRPWFEKVIAEKAHAEREAKRQADYWRQVAMQSQQGQQPAQQPAQGVPEGYIPVSELPRIQAQMAEASQFHATCDAIADTGAEIPGFSDAVSRLVTLGVNTQNPSDPVMQVVTALGVKDGAAALAALGNDPDEALRIARLPPTKMAVEVLKLVNKPAPAPKPVSRVPPPVTPLGANRAEAGGEPDAKLNPEAWTKWFLEQRRNRGR